MTTRGGRHRYGGVLGLTLAMATFALAAPDGRATRGLELAVDGAVLHHPPG